MIYYPFCTLLSCGIKDFCIISSPEYLPSYEKLFGDGSQLGIKITYKVQYKPRGIAESFIIAEEFINNDSVALILGDNIFHGMPRVKPILQGAVIFGYEVSDPRSYGVIEFDSDNNAVSIEEKPTEPKSNYAVPGLYFYDKNVVEYAKTLKPSARGEIEITDLNLIYLDKKQLTAVKFAKGTAWLDAGIAESLFESSAYVQAIQSRQGIKIGCIEEECFKRKYISKEQLKALIEKLPNSEYKKYLNKLL
jgi:glucose-1-phosphate thymidylyltransferase